MIEVSFSPTFKRAFKKKIKKNRLLEERFWTKLDLFIKNPFDKELRTHKLSGNLKDLWSFSIEINVRVIFFFADTKKAVLIDIGTHNEVY